MLYDDETEAILAIAVSSKATLKPLIIEYVDNVVYELGYGKLKIAIKCDGLENYRRCAEQLRTPGRHRLSRWTSQCARAKTTAAWRKLSAPGQVDSGH